MSNNKETAIIKYDENEIEIEKSDSKIANAISHIKNVIATSKSYDLLKYKFRDNGLVLFIYGPKCQDEDRVIARLEEVIRKYKVKRGNRKPEKVQVDSFIRKLLR
jgi:hypothetical protein